MAINQIFVNGQEVLSVRGDTVSESNLAQGETAHNRAGEPIVGQMGGDSDAYRITDPIGNIDNNDYIPFNDVSDPQQPKKKTPLSALLEKLGKAFLPSKGDRFDLDTASDTVDYQSTDIDGAFGDNNVTGMRYPSTLNILDRMKRIIMRTEAVVNPNGKIGWKSYVKNYDTDGNNVGQKGMQFNMDKSGNLEYQIDDFNAFRAAIQTVDQLGTEIPADSNLDDYMTAGTYRVPDDSTAASIDNLPLPLCGKVVVLDNGNGGLEQVYFPNHEPRILVRSYWNSSWGDWKELELKTAGAIYALIDGSNISDPDKFRENIKTIDQTGDKILVNSNLNDYVTAGTYYVISNTDAATISNIPTPYSGKLVVLYTDKNGGNVRPIQLYLTNSPIIYVRHRDYASDGWSSWKTLATTNDVQSAYDNYYGVGSVSGSSITASITGFTLVTGRIVVIRLSNGIPENATLNISSTGAKDIYYWGDNKVRAKDLIYTGAHYTFIYDGTRYRLISIGLTPTLYQRDYVADTSGYFGEIIGYGSNVYRIEEDLSKGRLRWNYFKNNAWRGDVELAEFPDLYKYGQYLMDVYGITGRRIYRTDDLNDFTESGTYQYVHDSEGLPANTPNWGAIRSFKLIVDRYSSDSRSEINQRITMINHSSYPLGFARTRQWNESTWGAWKQVASMDDISSATGAYLPLAGGTMTGKILLPVDSKGRTVASGAHRLSVQDTIENIINELRYSNGAWGSFNLGTAYTKDYTTIPAGWYNYFYIPHREGGENWKTPTSWDSDNVNYGTLMLFGMNNTNGMFRIRWQLSNSAVSVTELEDLQKGNIYVGTCATAAATKDKEATVDGNFVLRKGVRVAIKFTNTNTFSSQTSTPITLNVNGTGAKNIWYWSTHSGAGNTGTNTTVYGVAGRYATYVYDGTYWVWDGQSGESDTNERVYSKGSVTAETGTTYPAIKALTWREVYNNGYPAVYGNLLCMYGRGVSQLLIAWSGTSGQAEPMYFRSKRDTNDANYSDWDMVYSQLYPNIVYCTSSTEAATAAKVATSQQGKLKALKAGVIACVVHSVNNTASNCTLNIDGTGAKQIYYNQGVYTGSSDVVCGRQNMGIFYIYDGTYWRWMGMSRNDNSTYTPQSLGIGYGTCDTAAATTAKVASLSGYNLVTNGYVSIKFTYDVPANATLNINSKGAKSIYYHGSAIKVNYIKAGDIATFVYNGSRYDLVGIDRASAYATFETTLAAGATQVTFSGLPTDNTYTYDLYTSKAGLNYSAIDDSTSGSLTFTFEAQSTAVTCWLKVGAHDNDIGYYSTYTPQALGFGFGTCATAAATAAKDATLSNYNLINGGYVSVKFTYDVPANATLNINSKGAKDIYYRGAKITANIIRANDLATFIYNGSQYHLVGVDRDSTAKKNYIERSQCAWSDVIGTNYNTTNWSCNIHKSGNIMIGGLEIATNQGNNTITFPSYNLNTTNVFFRFPYHALAGYFECIVTVGATTYPAFISTNTINGTSYTTVILRNALTITANSNIKVTFVAFLDTD